MDQTARGDAGPTANDKDTDDDGPPDAKPERPAPPDVPQWVYTTSDVVYKGLPRTREMNDLTAAWVGRGLLSEADQKKLAKADRPPWWETVGVTAAFIGVMLGLACWKFSRTDY